jgi:gas vesicle protein
MAEHDELPYIVIERRSGGMGALIWGALIGAGVALLFAPRSGRETREEIRAGALRVRDRAEDAVRQVTDSMQETIGGVRGEVQDRLDTARDAFEAGRRAARDTRQEMEIKVREVRAGVRGGVEAARAGSAPERTDASPGAVQDDIDLGV